MHLPLLTIALPSLVAVSASALPEAPRALPIGAATVLFDELGDGVSWVRSASYKAAFGPDGAVFVPFLGSSAPRDFPLVFGAPSVACNGVDVELAGRANAVRAGDVVSFDRGVVDEVYVVGQSSIEQRFVVESRLGAGGLDVRIPVQSELEAQVDGDLLRFTSELGGVSYGSATAIDAAGRTLPLERTFADGAIVIHVPASFAASAAYPLTIDPIVAAFGVFTNTSQAETSPDVAYDAITERSLVVTEFAFSATDHDVLSVLLERDGTRVPGSDLLVDATTANWATPRVANIGYGSSFGVVAAVGTVGNRQIQARVRSLTAFGAPAILSDGDDGDPSLPDIGGGDQLVSQRFLAVWQSQVFAGDRNVLARVIASNGTLPAGVIRVADDVVQFDERPAVASGAFSGEFAIVWQRAVALGNHDLYVARVRNDSTITLPATVIENSAADDTSPSISDLVSSLSGGVVSMVAFQRDVGGNLDVLAGELTFSGVLEGVVNFSTLFPSTSGFDQFAPAIESDQHRFLLAWSERNPGGTDIYAAEIHGAGLSIVLGAVTHAAITSGATDARDVRIGSRIVEDGQDLGLFLVWSDEVLGNATDVFGARYELEVGVPPRAVCFGDGTGSACPCGNQGAIGHGCASSVNPSGALLASTGVSALLAETFVLQGSGMPAGVACLYFQGTALNAPAISFGDGQRCATGTIIRLGTKFNSAGGSSAYPSAGDQPVSVRGGLNANGGKRYYQAWYRNAASFCTSATFNLSNALEVFWCPL